VRTSVLIPSQHCKADAKEAPTAEVARLFVTFVPQDQCCAGRLLGWDEIKVVDICSGNGLVAVANSTKDPGDRTA